MAHEPDQAWQVPANTRALRAQCLNAELPHDWTVVHEVDEVLLVFMAEATEIVVDLVHVVVVILKVIEPSNGMDNFSCQDTTLSEDLG